MFDVQEFLNEVQTQADQRIDELFDRLIEQLLNPAVKPDHICKKHDDYANKARSLGILHTKYKRLYFHGAIGINKWNEVTDKYIAAKIVFKHAECTCTSKIEEDKLHAEGICDACSSEYGTKNSCKHPVHMQFKRGEMSHQPTDTMNTLNSITHHAADLADTPIAFDAGSGW